MGTSPVNAAAHLRRQPSKAQTILSPVRIERHADWIEAFFDSIDPMRTSIGNVSPRSGAARRRLGRSSETAAGAPRMDEHQVPIGYDAGFESRRCDPAPLKPRQTFKMSSVLQGLAKKALPGTLRRRSPATAEM
jgi:hypothetical protein